MNDWYEAEQRVERAHQLAESRQWDAALAEIDAAIDINPTNGAWQAHRGYILDQLERFETAISAYRTSIRLEPGDAEVMLALGVDLTRLSRSSEAIDVLNDVERLAPDLEASYCYRIWAYSELGEHDNAEAMFYLAQQLKPDCPHCFFHVGSSLAARGMYKKAIYCWGRTLDIDPNYPGVRACIAQAYRDQNLFDRAREYFLAELRQDPGNVELLFDMAELELEAGQPARSAAKLRQITELDPDYAQAHFALGEVLLELDEPKEALQALRTAARLDAKIPRLHLRLGEAALQLSRHREAVRHLSAAYREDCEDEAVLLAWGNCLLHLGRPGDAADKFRQVLSIDETAPVALHNLSVCCFLMGDYEAGLAQLRKAIKINPSDALAMQKAALLLMHQDRWAEARAMIDQALVVNPDDAALRTLGERLWRFRLHAKLRRWTRFLRFNWLVPRRKRNRR